MAQDAQPLPTTPKERKAMRRTLPAAAVARAKQGQSPRASDGNETVVLARDDGDAVEAWGNCILCVVLLR